MLSNFMHATNRNSKTFLWIDFVKNVFIKCGHVYIWDSQYFPNRKWLYANFKQKLTDLFISDFHAKKTTKAYILTKDYLRQPSNLKIILIRHLINF